MASKMVLIVDDEPDNIEYAAAILRSDGISSVSAANGREGLDKARTEKPDLLSAPKVKRMLGCDEMHLVELVLSGTLKPAIWRGDKLFFIRSDVEPHAKPRPCIICGRPIGKGRQRYCSEECYRETWRYRNWSAARRVRHQELVRGQRKQTKGL